MSKPSEFYVGVLDLFAILLPGAIATAILEPRVGPLIFNTLAPAPSTEGAKWAYFLVFAYFVGHVVFLVGSYIDRLYDPVRKRLNPYNNESAYSYATAIRDGVIDAAQRSALNTFQWSRSVLIAKCPAAAEDVHRLEADSKFFRSLLVICLLAAIAFFSQGSVREGLVSIALMLPCFLRYYERRLKSTTQAYIHVITLHRLGLLA
jgi:hypothetical protein